MDFIVEHQPELGRAESRASRWYWHGHLESLVGDLDLLEFVFPRGPA